MVLGTLFNQASGFLVFIALSRILSPVEFGLVAFATLFIDLARPVLTGGISDAVVNEKEWTEIFVSTAFWLNALVGVTGALLLVILGLPLTSASGHDAVGPILVVLAISLLLESLSSIPTAILRRDFRYKQMTKRIAYTSILGGVAGIAAAYAGWGVWALVVQRIISTGTGLLFLWLSARWFPQLKFDGAIARRIAKFASGMVSAQLLSNLNGQAAGLVVGFAIGPTALALFRAGNRILLLVTQLTITPIQRVALTAFSRAQSRENVPTIYKRLTGASALIACPAFIGLGAMSYDLVYVLLGEKWIESSNVMMISSLVIGVQVINYFFTPSLAAIGNTKGSVYYFASALIGNTIFGLIAAPFGLLAVVISQTFRGYLGLPISLAILKKELSLPPRELIAEVYASFLASLFMGAVLLALREFVLMNWSPLMRLVVLVPGGAILFLGAMALFGKKSLRKNYSELKPLLPKRLKSYMGIS